MLYLLIILTTYVAMATLHVVNKKSMVQCDVEEQPSWILLEKFHGTGIVPTHKSIVNVSVRWKTGIGCFNEVTRSKRWMIWIPIFMTHSEKSLLQLLVDRTTRGIGVYVAVSLEAEYIMDRSYFFQNMLTSIPMSSRKADAAKQPLSPLHIHFGTLPPPPPTSSLCRSPPPPSCPSPGPPPPSSCPSSAPSPLPPIGTANWGS